MVRHLQGHLIAGDKFETNFPESARTLLGPVWRVSQARGLLEFTGNSEDWLASKKNVKKHACKVRYAVRHLLRTGSTYRISESETPAWVRGSRDRFNGRRARSWRPDSH